MSQNRPARQQNTIAGVPTPVAVEVMRNAAESAKAADEGGADKEEKSIPVFWRVFGGTVFSICSLIIMTAYSGFTSSLAEAKADLSSLASEVRKETTRLSEAQAALIHKDEVETTMSAVWRNLTDLGADQKELAALREQCARLLADFKKGEQQRRDLEAEMQKVREEQAADAERRTLVEDVAKLRERLAVLERRKVGVVKD